MSNLPINYHSFEINKNKIKQFSNTLPAPIELKSVSESSFKFFDHRVTGAEFNSAIEQVQKAFRDSNNVNKKIIKEFSVIYDAFESLDKDYIQGIKSSVASADKSSKQALEACAKARVAREEIKKTQEVLIKNVKNLQGKIEVIDSSLSKKDAAIEILSKFINSEIAEQKQLRDKMTSTLDLYKSQIAEQNRTGLELKDKITANVEAYETKISEQSKIILELKDKIASFTEHYRAEIEEQNKKFVKLNNKINSYAANYRAKAEEQSRNIAELNRNIYSYAEYYNNKIGEQDRYIDSCVEEYRTKIAEQSQSVTELNSKIDSYAEKFEAQFDTQNKTITELSNFINFKLEQQRLLNNKVASDIKAHQAQLEEQNKTIAKLNNKIKYAYLVSAIAIAIACAHFFMK